MWILKLILWCVIGLVLAVILISIGKTLTIILGGIVALVVCFVPLMLSLMI